MDARNQLIVGITRWTEKRHQLVSADRRRGGRRLSVREEGLRCSFCLQQHRILLKAGKRAMNGLVDLNDHDLHGNDDCLFMFAEWEGHKSLPDQSAAYFSPATLWQDF